MVKFKTLIKVIEENLIKCSNEYLENKIFQRIEGLSIRKGYETLFADLKSQNFLNPLEEKDYEKKMKRYLNLEDKYRKLNDIEKEELESLYYDLFSYNRRLVEKYEVPQPPNIDLNNYSADNKLSMKARWDKNGKLENAQIQAQQEALKWDLEIVHKEDEFGNRFNSYTGEDFNKMVALDCYFDGDCRGINYNIKNEKYLEKLDKQIQNDINYIDEVMEDSPGLIEDTILYRGGAYWNIHWNPGDHIKGFKGYQSTTFQESVAKEYNAEYKEQTGERGMLLRIHTPKGTKGICGNDKNLNNSFIEHEYVLPRNVGYTIVNIDYKKMIADIVLDEQ